MRLKITTEKLVCKLCGSGQIVKYGRYRDSQHWLCRTCGKKWTDNDAVAGGKLPAKCVAYSLGAYYDGLSINAVRRNLRQQYGVCPSSATVFEWVNRYTREIIEKTAGIHPKVGDVWIADETYVRVDRRKKGDVQVENPYSKSRKAKWIVFWDIIDAKTRFLLASHITTTRGAQDAKILMDKAARRAGKVPRAVVTDKLAAYLDGIELSYGGDTEHRQGGPFDVVNNTNLVERLQGTVKARTKVMRALRNRETAELFTDGWLAYYNHMRPHMALGDRTPATLAGIDSPFGSWSDVVGVQRDNVVRTEVVTETFGVERVHPAVKYRPRKAKRKSMTSQAERLELTVGWTRSK